VCVKDVRISICTHLCVCLYMCVYTCVCVNVCEIFLRVCVCVCARVCCTEGIGAEGKREKTKIIPVTQPKARAGWPKRLRLVQATP